MRKRWAQVSTLALVGIIIACAAILFLQREPAYQGKPLSYWLVEYGKGRKEREQAIAAITAMGEKAVPFLLTELTGDEPNWRRYYRTKWPAFPEMIKRFTPKPAIAPRYSTTAAELLGELGPKARAAAPRLIQYAKEPAVWPTFLFSAPGPASTRPIVITSSTGNAVTNSRPPAVQIIPPITGANGTGGTRLLFVAPPPTPPVNRNQTARTPTGLIYNPLLPLVVRALGRIGSDDPEAVQALLSVAKYTDCFPESYNALQNTNLLPAVRAAFPLARQYLGRTNQETRQLAVVTFGQLVPENNDAVAVLIPVLRNDPSVVIKCTCIKSLALAQGKYELVLPALAEALAVDNQEMRSHCAFAFEQLQTRVDVLPVLLKALRDPSAASRANAAWVLGGLGAKARATLPAVREALDDPDFKVRDTAANALMQIDPKATRKGP